MMHSTKILGLLLTAVIGLVACAPRPVYRLKPLAQQSTWYHGTEYLHSSTDSIAVTVAYIRHHNDHVIFDVEVTNYSEHIVRVDPADFSYKAYTSVKKHQVMAAGYAINPETKLLQIDKDIAVEKASKRTTLLFAAIGATAMVVEEVADSEEDTPRDEITEMNTAYLFGASTAAGLDASNDAIHFLHNRKAYWTVKTLRKTDLFPGGYVRGKVLFPIIEEAGAYSIKINVGHTVHIFRFRQLKYDP